ncbi:carboxypeptidase regulatory-like domain-containing protein [Moheibacter stercoris]|uniref:Fibronectin type-III domain-containing protein n=1 Tax=Moheibacter stercoris TaxID=1628251 RepID=A0ABV2LW38_9FLAO
MKTIHILSIFLFLLFGCSEDLVESNAKGTIKGSVRIDLTNEPLENVKITTTPSTLTVYTDENGEFEISGEVPLGDYTIKAELDGYLTEVEAVNLTQYNQTITVVIEMVTDETLNTPPTTPILISPTNLATDLPRDLTLIWVSTDVDEDSLTYRVKLTNNSTNQIVEFEEIIGNNLEVEDLDFGTTYTWQVIVSDGINPEVFSESSQFTIKADPEYRHQFVRLENGNYVVYSTNLDETIPITNSTTSSWRPHKNNVAQKLAFLQSIGGQTHLVTSHLNGSNFHQVSQIPLNGFRQEQLDFAWKTDGSQFIFPSFDKLYKINYDGTGQHQIYQTSDGQFITKVAWSYDSSKIAITTNNLMGYEAKIILLDSNGNFLETIVENQQGAIGTLDFNITGTQLLYTHDISGYQDAQYRQLDTHIFLYDFGTQNTTDLSLVSEKPIGTIDIDARFSPDNGSIIFTNTPNDMISIKSVYSISLDDLEERNLLIYNAEMPDYE